MLRRVSKPEIVMDSLLNTSSYIEACRPVQA